MFDFNAGRQTTIRLASAAFSLMPLPDIAMTVRGVRSKIRTISWMNDDPWLLDFTARIGLVMAAEREGGVCKMGPLVGKGIQRGMTHTTDCHAACGRDKRIGLVYETYTYQGKNTAMNAVEVTEAVDRIRGSAIYSYVHGPKATCLKRR